MNKQSVYQLILQQLQDDLQIILRAAQTAYETATHEENIAENKYDTLGLEAAYLAAGQSRRVEEIRQALSLWQSLVLRPTSRKPASRSEPFWAWKMKRATSSGCF